MSLRQYLMIKQAVRYTNDGMAIPDDEPNEPGIPIPDDYSSPRRAVPFAQPLPRRIQHGNTPKKRINRRPNAVSFASSPWRDNRQFEGQPGAAAGGVGTSDSGIGGPAAGAPVDGIALPGKEPPFVADDWDRAEYYRAMANKENNLGAITLGGGALTGGVAAMLLNKYYNGDKFKQWLDKKLISDPTSRYGRFMSKATEALSGAIPGIGTAAAAILGGVGSRWLANKYHKRYKRIPKPANANELGAAAREEYLNGGFDGTDLPGGWYVPPVENSKGKLRPAYSVDDPVPAPETSRGVEYWNPQVKKGPAQRLY